MKAIENREKKDLQCKYSSRLAGKTSLISEKEYQRFVMQYLEENNGFVIRNSKHYDRLHAIDRELLFTFLNDTQPEAMDRLERIYKGDLENVIIGLINTEVTKKKGSLLNVLKHGIEISGETLKFMFTRPATNFNQDLSEKYQKIFFCNGGGLG